MTLIMHLKGKVIECSGLWNFCGIRKRNRSVLFIKTNFSWDKKEHKEYKVGDEVEFKVIVVDKLDKKLSGSYQAN